MRQGWIRAALTAVVVVAAFTVGGCATEPPAPSTNAGGVTGDVTVYAAASLTGSFTQIRHDFEGAPRGSKVISTSAGSSALAPKITAVAPGDVFAAGGPATMKAVTDAGGADGAPVTF